MSIKQGANYKWLVFFTVGLGTFMSVVDHGSVNIALPTIASHFETDLPTVQWVALGYALAISAFLLPAGRLADQFGRKGVYIAGFVIFGLGAVLAGSSPNLWLLIVFKIFSAAGAAMIMANGMAILTAVFQASERGKAVGSHMTIVGSGGIFGPVLGGLLVGALGWRYVFFINLPIAALGVAVALLVLSSKWLSQAQEENQQGGFDWPGAGLSAGALVMFLMAMTNGHRIGWSSPVIAIALVVSVALLGLFLWRQSQAPVPMLDLGLFKRRAFSLGALAGFTAFLASSSLFFLMPFYLQKIAGYSPGQAGLIMVSSAACMAVMGPISGRLSDRFGWRPFNIGGAALSAAGMFLLSRVSDDSTLSLVVPALILQGLGMGMFHSSNHSSILGAVEPARYGIASAFINLNRNTATTTGLAIATAIVVGTMASMGFEPNLDALTDGVGAGVAHAFSAGLRNAYTMAGSLMVAVMVISVLNGRRVGPSLIEPAVRPMTRDVEKAPQGTPD